MHQPDILGRANRSLAHFPLLGGGGGGFACVGQFLHGGCNIWPLGGGGIGASVKLLLTSTFNAA